MYLPPATPPPAYDAYADPATAHGWQNAYDETRELPPVIGDPPARCGAGARPPGRDRGRRGACGRRRVRCRGSPPGVGWHARRLPGFGSGSGSRASRRVVVASGALGAVAVAALIAGFSLSGSSPAALRGFSGGSPAALRARRTAPVRRRRTPCPPTRPPRVRPLRRPVARWGTRR
ncbi:hypothetical protein ACR6C2_29320 [Streptomyces sp. INA 01156]